MRILTMTVVLCIVCLLQGCTINPVTPNPPKKQEPKIYGLTGQVQHTQESPTFMIMINNAPAARPQTGLNRADVVVEMLAEGEITRFAAFYQSQQSGPVGPVRSVRDYYYEIGKGLGAVIVSAGGAKGTLHRIRREGYSHIDGVHQDGDYFTRVGFRRAPHNLYINFSEMKRACENKGYKNIAKAKYVFRTTSSILKGKEAQRIQLTYHPLNTCGYIYDPHYKVYTRYTNGKEQIDYETRKPLTMNNVLIAFARHRIVDAVGHRGIELKEGGDGYLLQEGRYAAIQWKMREGLFIPFIEGREMSMIPGRTWVNVLDLNAKVMFTK